MLTRPMQSVCPGFSLVPWYYVYLRRMKAGSARGGTSITKT